MKKWPCSRSFEKSSYSIFDLKALKQGGQCPGNQGKVRGSKRGLRGQGKVMEFEGEKKVREFKQVLRTYKSFHQNTIKTRGNSCGSGKSQGKVKEDENRKKWPPAKRRHY